MTTCDRCLFRGGVLTTECNRCVKTKDGYVDRFEREAREALDEFVRLKELFKDVCWYNFETRCRDWRRPWRRSDHGSSIELHAHTYEHHWNRGHRREVARYPYYFQGELRDAPPLPPQIILVELQIALDHLRACKECVSASYDWAPGGKKYEALRRTTLVGRGGGRKRRFSSATMDCDGTTGLCDTAPFSGL